MVKTLTEADFDNLSWHDCYIWGIDLRVGNPDENDWTCDLVLDIEYIAEWICGTDGGAQFRVAPATLAFHGVTDAKIDIDWGDSGFRTALNGASIDRIGRERVQDQKIYLDRPYYSWRIHLNWPKGGEIAFGAVGFTQTLLAEPILTDQQQLKSTERRRIKRRSTES